MNKSTMDMSAHIGAVLSGFVLGGTLFCGAVMVIEAVSVRLSGLLNALIAGM